MLSASQRIRTIWRSVIGVGFGGFAFNKNRKERRPGPIRLKSTFNAHAAFRLCGWSRPDPDLNLGRNRMIRVPTHRPATHPGEILLEDFLKPLGLTQKHLADAINVPFQRVNEIVSGKRGVTPSTALRLAKFFGVSAGFWLDLQMRCDLQAAADAEKEHLKKIRPVTKLAA
jgi:addiction module HigA family antidote